MYNKLKRIDADKLVVLVLNGKKTVTTSLYEFDSLPTVGDVSILTDSNNNDMCILETKEVIVTEFKNITWDLAKLEGENKFLEEWIKVHIDYFSKINTNFNDNTKVIFEIFEVIEKFKYKGETNMKILFISDIHGININLKKIEKVIEKEKIDKLVVLGDLYYAGPTYNQKYEVNSMNVKDTLTKYSDKIICLKGNCDSDVDIKASDFPICNNLALICVDGLDIYLTHGNEYNLEKNRKFNRKGILVYGHEHIPYIKKEKDMVYINAGSISIPKENNNPTYMMYENRKFTIYDIEENIFDSIEI